MKLKFFFCLFLVCSVFVYEKSRSDTRFLLDSLGMENVEALAINEYFGSGNKKICAAVTDMYENGILYKCRAIVECKEGGDKDCKEGVYVKEKNLGQWSDWIRIG